MPGADSFPGTLVDGEGLADPAAEDLLEAAGAGGILTDAEGRIRWLAPGLARRWGLAPPRWLGRHRAKLSTHPELAAWVGDLLASPRAGPVYGQVGNRWFRVVRTAARGRPEGWEWLAAVEVTAERCRLDRLERQALQDELTGLANRRCFRQRLVAAVNSARRHGAPLSLAYLDVDDFKGINDRLGHAAGDRVLATIGGLLIRGVRREDTAARLGGEEFGLLLAHAGPGDARARAEGVRARLAAHSFGLGGEWVVTASIGVAGGEPTRWYGTEEDAAGSLLGAADRALYKAKRGGKNRVCCTRPGPP